MFQMKAFQNWVRGWLLSGDVVPIPLDAGLD